MIRVSDHISYTEAVKSQTAIRKSISNKPSSFALTNMRMVAINCFEPIRNYHNKPIHVSSFYRSFLLNSSIGGSKNSQHLHGDANGVREGAMDIDADYYNNGITNKQIFDWLRSNVKFDQLIWEYGDDSNPAWVHVSYREGRNRMQVLKASRSRGRLIYTPL